MVDIKREIIVGRNSSVWRTLSKEAKFQEHFVAIGHAEMESFTFAPGDRIWILSYARNLAANRDMFSHLTNIRDIEVVYISTATTNVEAVTQCYKYPRVKRRCEQLGQSMLNARILTIGVVYEHEKELPGGTTIATSVAEIAKFIKNPIFPSQSLEPVRLFSPITRPFSGRLEHFAFGVYGGLQKIANAWPCLLRPLDIVLRALGWRWYGYLYLSNRLWLMTIL